MDKDFYLCKEGKCKYIDFGFLNIDKSVNHYGICCDSCEKKSVCVDVCSNTNRKFIKSEDCDFRVNYRDIVEKILKEKREELINTRKQIAKLEKEIAKIDGELKVKSPLECKICGSEMIYDEMNIRLTCPPKILGGCRCGNYQLVDVKTYSELKKR